MPPINWLWACDCGESAWSPVLAVDDWGGQPEPVGPDCPECGGGMEMCSTTADSPPVGWNEIK